MTATHVPWAPDAARITDALRTRAQADPDDVVAVDLSGAAVRAGVLTRDADVLADRLDELAGPGLVVLQSANQLAALPAVAGILRSRHALVPAHPRTPAAALGRLRPVATVMITPDGPLVVPEPFGPARAIWSAQATAPQYAVGLCILTSGTTGRPRLIAAPHRQILAAATRIQHRLGYRPGDIVPVISPLSFDYGLYQLLLAWGSGARALVDPRMDTVANVLVAVGRAGATVLPLVPTMLRAVAASPMVGRMDTGAVRLITTTGDLLTEADARAAAAAFPNATVLPMYGLSECKRVAVTPPGTRRPDGAVGLPLPGTDVAIVDEEGRPVPAGEPGELMVAGTHLTLGYLDDDAATAGRFSVDPRAGIRLLRTGDRLRRDRDGWLYWVGRSHDLIKTAGYRIDPAEIETAAAATGLVLESGAYGRPDPLRGQVPVLRVRCPAGMADTDRLTAALRSALPPWAVPRIEVSEVALPHTPNGKIDRAAIAASDPATGPTTFGVPSGPAGMTAGTGTPAASPAAIVFSTNLINCHSKAVHSAYALPGAAGRHALFELATTVPFAVRAQPADPNRILIPWLDPDIGLDRAATAFGLDTEVRGHDGPDAAMSRLLRWLRCGPVVLGPLDLGRLTYHTLAGTLHGCDHYVVALGRSAGGAVVLVDPEGYAQVEVDEATLLDAWAARHVPEGRAGYLLRRFTPTRRSPAPADLIATIAASATANLRAAHGAAGSGPDAYRTVAGADLGPSDRRGLYVLLPATAARARLAARFAAAAATALPDADRWRRLAELWDRQVTTLARIHHALVHGRDLAGGLHIAADAEQHITELAFQERK